MKKPVKKKVNKQIAKAKKTKTIKSSSTIDVKDLVKQNQSLQSEINLMKKKISKLEKESLILTKKLMESGYKPKFLT
ncbi:hypothetical protein [Leptospira sp. GIMC2001]|uniref:hypothetical protein n=1 Tax=Leptospira sp. GIMC2001 TaxID=1513297 RepID=UPI00234A4402|nr:hypothetical protein [Leptospira sp. GIMC2001]WCL51151.1 hypothetical protein O4O04_10155 [Leptospira sp. GIMC2001]